MREKEPRGKITKHSAEHYWLELSDNLFLFTKTELDKLEASIGAIKLTREGTEIPVYWDD